jgi:hypothetical protein
LTRHLLDEILVFANLIQIPAIILTGGVAWLELLENAPPRSAKMRLRRSSPPWPLAGPLPQDR